MKQIQCIAITLIMLLLITLSTAFADTNVTQVRTGERGASFRSSPEVTEYNKIRGIHADTVLNVYDYVNGWYYVEYRGEYGYVASDMVTVVRRGNSSSSSSNYSYSDNYSSSSNSNRSSSSSSSRSSSSSSRNSVQYPPDYEVTSDTYQVYSTNPAGYCYMYNMPSSVNGTNLGRYNNGEYIEIIDWYADDNYARVYSPRTQKRGYIRKTSLVPADDYKPIQYYAYVDSYEPYGYCYLYDRPSSTYGNNLGRHNNGELIYVLDWYADDNYAKVECANNGKIGYIRKACLSLQ